VKSLPATLIRKEFPVGISTWLYFYQAIETKLFILSILGLPFKIGTRVATRFTPDPYSPIIDRQEE